MKIFSNLHYFLKEVLILISSPVFLMLTAVGNGIIGLTAVVFYFLERDTNPKMQHLMDAVWWSYSTATTTGYGDITPVTVQGKVLGIMLMLMGTALFAMYTGLFAEIILTASGKRPRA